MTAAPAPPDAMPLSPELADAMELLRQLDEDEVIALLLLTDS